MGMKNKIKKKKENTFRSIFQYSPIEQHENVTYVMAKSMYTSIKSPKLIPRDCQHSKIFCGVNILEIWKP